MNEWLIEVLQACERLKQLGVSTSAVEPIIVWAIKEDKARKGVS